MASEPQLNDNVLHACLELRESEFPKVAAFPAVVLSCMHDAALQPPYSPFQPASA